MSGKAKADPNPTEELPLSKAAECLIQECRMLLPGLQALFGFQLTAVFSQGFDEKLNRPQQQLHLLATGLVAVATALIMTPAAYHRQTGTHQVSERFISLSTRLLLWSMPPLIAGICLDFYLVARLIIDGVWGAIVTTAIGTAFVFLWFILPRAWPPPPSRPTSRTIEDPTMADRAPRRLI